MDEDERMRRETARVLTRFFEREMVNEASKLFQEHDPLAELARLIGSAEPLTEANGHALPLREAVLQYRPNLRDAFFPEDHKVYTEMNYED